MNTTTKNYFNDKLTAVGYINSFRFISAINGKNLKKPYYALTFAKMTGSAEENNLVYTYINTNIYSDIVTKLLSQHLRCDKKGKVLDKVFARGHFTDLSMDIYIDRNGDVRPKMMARLHEITSLKINGGESLIINSDKKTVSENTYISEAEAEFIEIRANEMEDANCIDFV